MKITENTNQILESTSYSFASILNLFKDLGILYNFQEIKNGTAFDVILNRPNSKPSNSLRFLVIGYQNLRFLKDGRVTSPLIYHSIFKSWAKLSLKHNMHLLGMNPNSGKYYISNNIFWEVIRYISHLPITKAIAMNELDLSLSSSSHDDLTPTQYNTIIQTIVSDKLTDLSQKPTPFELLKGIELLFCKLPKYFSLYKRLYSMPRKTLLEIPDVELLSDLTDLSKSIFGLIPDINELLKLSPNRIIDCKFYQNTIIKDNFFYLNDFRYWIDKSAEESPESKDISMIASTSMMILQTIIPRIIDKFRIVRKHSAESVYYWLDNDVDFLKTLLCFDPPEVHTSEDMLNLISKYDDYKREFEKEIAKYRKLYPY